MDRILLLVTVTIIATTAAKAQSVTYNHDSPKQNQVTVMETGTGALSPDLYYSILHNKYKKSAAAKNKLSFRTLAGVNLYRQKWFRQQSASATSAWKILGEKRLRVG